MSYVTIYFISTFILDSWSPETIEGDSHLQWCQEKQKNPTNNNETNIVNKIS